MGQLIVSNHLKQRKKLKIAMGIVRFSVEDIKFEIMPLSDELKEDLQLCMTYEETLFFAAEHGVVINCKIASEDEDYSELLDELWGDEIMDIDCDPCVRQRVGEAVCSISGLNDYLESVRKAEVIKVGEMGEFDNDHHIDSMNDITADSLSQDDAVHEVNAA